MTTFLIAAVTADGFIARHSRHLADWTSKEDKRFFTQKTKEAGVVIMGLNTFKTIGKPLGDRYNIVYAPASPVGRPAEEKLQGVEITQENPEVLLARLEQKGYREAAICGGAAIYTMFMEAGAVDALYLTVEPVLFGQGLSLFTKPLDVQLALQSVEKLNDTGTVLMSFKIKN